VAIQMKVLPLSVKAAKKRKKVWIASRHASLAVAMTGACFRWNCSLFFCRNSGRETGSHPRLRGGMLSLELLWRLFCLNPRTMPRKRTFPQDDRFETAVFASGASLARNGHKP